MSQPGRYGQLPEDPWGQFGDGPPAGGRAIVAPPVAGNVGRHPDADPWAQLPERGSEPERPAPEPDIPGRPGTIYMLCFRNPDGSKAWFSHAGHYVGWASDLQVRLAAHERGQGARLLEVVHQAGIGWALARTRTGDRTQERLIKQQGGATRYCPRCSPAPRNGPWRPGGREPELEAGQ